MLLQCFAQVRGTLAQFIEEGGVLNGDYSLVGEVFNQLDLLVDERADFLAVNREDTDKLIVLEHRDGENGPEPPKIDRRDEDRFAFDVSRLSGDIRDMNRPPGLDDTAQRRSRTRSLETRRTVHIADVTTEPAYVEGEPIFVAAVNLGRFRTVLAVPMLKNNELSGVFAIYCQEGRPSIDNQPQPVPQFPPQDVIAIHTH